MSEPSAVHMEAPAPSAESRFDKKLIPTLMVLAWWIGSLFLAAGRLDWVRGWISVALFVVGMTAVKRIVQHYNPAVLKERAKWRRKDTKGFDKIFLAIYLPLYLIQPAIGGFDAVRYHWSSMPFVFVYVGSILFTLALAMITWVMIVNPFAESSVRIQTDRGHTVITSGPYRIVRHPMYVGIILLYFSTALIWGSVWTLRLGALLMVLLIWRTAREDRTLRQELPGYEQYAAVTRYRLLPGVW
ncbi:MAG: methyltransferase family protein [Candidatus Sulfotelmatobacter sp.]